jgi:hypothetical protein
MYIIHNLYIPAESFRSFDFECNPLDLIQFFCNNRTFHIFQDLYKIIDLNDSHLYSDSLHKTTLVGIIVMTHSNPDAINYIENIILTDYSFHKKNISLNPGAIEILKKHPELIDYILLCRNENAIDLIENYIDSIPKNNIEYHINEIETVVEMECMFSILSCNENAIHILEKYPEKINWNNLSSNPNAMKIIKNNLDKINWDYLSKNTNHEAISILENNIDKINWEHLSCNPSAMNILKNNPNKINWEHLSSNTNSDAIEMLTKNETKINWENLSGNPSAIHIIEKNLDKISKCSLCKNENAIHLIFNINKDKLIERIQYLKEELIAYVYFPDRLINICKLYTNMSFNEYLNILTQY